MLDDMLRIGYILKRFPSLSQTFILNEILELEHQGVVVEILSLRKPRPEPTHSRLEELKARVCYLEDLTEPEHTSPLEQAANWVKTHRLQHLHAHFATSAAEFAMLMAKMARISYSFTAHARDIFHDKVDKLALVERIQFTSC
jgi:colanic acid/amylovoran biosynthesis glycosyltransferase